MSVAPRGGGGHRGQSVRFHPRLPYRFGQDSVAP